MKSIVLFILFIQIQINVLLVFSRRINALYFSAILLLGTRSTLIPINNSLIV